MFEGFTRLAIKTTGATINIVTAGHGLPVLLLPGYPEMPIWDTITAHA